MRRAQYAWEEKIRRTAARPGIINLGGGLPSAAQFPRADLAAAFRRVIGPGQTDALQYGWAEGEHQLRQWVAARLAARGARVTADDVIVTNGAQQAIGIAADLVLRKGDAVGVEPASYPAALEQLRARGFKLTTLGHGRAAYVMPGINNPTGQPFSAQSMAAVRASGAWIIEDDAYGELKFDGRLAPLLLAQLPRRTLHVGTLSKTLCPGLRVGWLVVPPSLRRRARELKENDDLQANSLTQAIAGDYLRGIDFDRRLQRLRRFYLARATRLTREVKKALPSWRFVFPQGGFSVWVDTGAAVLERRFAEIALDEGVSFDSGSAFVAAPATSGSKSALLRLCFSSVPPARFAESARRLARAWARVQRASPSKRRRR